MTNNKQSSVQQFWDKIALKLTIDQLNEFMPLFDQAKAMHNEERFQDFKEGFQAALESLQSANNLVQSKKLGGNNEQ